jgi:sugar phosphate isomerase/epimerase
MPDHRPGRRRFLQRSAALAALGAFGGGMKLANAASTPRFRMGLQLYTVREPMAKDPVGTLTQAKSFGYTNFETYGFEPDTVKYYGMPARDFRKVLDDLGLATTTGHYDLHRYHAQPATAMTTYIERCIEGATALGQKYITWAWLDPQSRDLDAFKRVAERLNMIGRQAAKAGLRVAYHNHDFEFVPHDGKIGYDIILNETDPDLVKMQLDLFWVAHSSARTPHELFALAPGRFTMWHVKDMDAQKRYTELGNGSIDFTKIMPDAKLAGLEEYFVEQGDNFAVSPMKSIEVSARYVRLKLEPAAAAAPTLTR